ncbi:HEAT repeat domain-containing protein [Halosolutus gelatinilyticus]|uniref:HEAT repeat domain-containing protein n=1 Tax=Halosolutus gelatinilyticus TaxID=2931975 RepID=UPI001FF45C79|nr:HEAT repeat domain-containing protein [Halosolutus gelatinilyticus]
MDDSLDPSSIRELTEHLKAGTPEDVRECLDAFLRTEPERRKQLLRALRSIADDQPSTVCPYAPGFVRFLTDEDRSVRLTTAKLFVALARGNPDAVVAAVGPLADRVADPDEFYYVRSRTAEALGYVAIEHPAEVATPELLADLRIGLSFDEPEVKEKLAKALAHVALGDPGRLCHQISTFAEHLDDEDELVRYHLCTAIVAVGCEHPKTLVDAVDELAARLGDDCTHVRGRAAEALGLLARTGVDPTGVPDDRLVAMVDAEDEPFAIDRARYALAALDDGPPDGECGDAIGSVAAIREHTDDVVAEVTTADGGECPRCELALPKSAPPVCPRCGTPY